MTRAPQHAAPAIFFCGVVCRKNRQTPPSEFFEAPCAARKGGAGRLAFFLFKKWGCAPGSATGVFYAALLGKGLCSAKAVFCAATKEGGKDKMIFAVRKRGEVLSNSEERGAKKGEIRMRRGASVPLSALACAAAQMNAGASEGERTKNSPPGEKAGKKSAVAKRAEDRRPRRASPAFDGRGEGGQRASEGGHRLFFCAG